MELLHHTAIDCKYIYLPGTNNPYPRPLNTGSLLVDSIELESFYYLKYIQRRIYNVNSLTKVISVPTRGICTGFLHHAQG